MMATTARPTQRFYPALDKRNLFALGYIAAQSTHSTGTAVDLTLVRLPAAPAPRFDPAARYGPCTGPAAKRAPDNSSTWAPASTASTSRATARAARSPPSSGAGAAR